MTTLILMLLAFGLGVLVSVARHGQLVDGVKTWGEKLLGGVENRLWTLMRESWTDANQHIQEAESRLKADVAAIEAKVDMLLRRTGISPESLAAAAQPVAAANQPDPTPSAKPEEAQSSSAGQ
ncbi:MULTISPECIES: hypothetical protein [Acidobacterium]|uniref:hypothetical protein n=1 Tax=Acidobacterium TaxID=33973 RepID=UPI0002D882C1|nr:MULTISPECIES: hypothetical protein [Acidobacterium]HCT62062.1 hypothetical protein [Acidobacterium sp.]